MADDQDEAAAQSIGLETRGKSNEQIDRELAAGAAD